jgi:hypothetical protein
MSQLDIANFLQYFFRSNPRNIASIYVTGGGVQAVEWLFTTPGASRCMQEAGIPYGYSALGELLKQDKVTGSVSAETAIHMARMVRAKAASQFLHDTRSFTELSSCNLFSISCTAALVSTEPKKGLHRCFVTGHTNSRIVTRNIILRKGARSRSEEDHVSSRIILDTVADCANINPLPHDYTLPALDSTDNSNSNIVSQDETVSLNTVPITFDHLIQNVMSGITSRLLCVSKHDHVPSHNSDIMDDFNFYEDVTLPSGTFVFPGSFNPLHIGHIHLVRAALKSQGWEPPSEDTKDSQDVNANSPLVAFEISAINADKPPLNAADLQNRIRQFCSELNPVLKSEGITNVAVCISSKPYFHDKAKIFPNCKFIVGGDTLNRLLMKKYYLECKQEEMLAALVGIAYNGCSFVVGGRLIDDKFITANKILLQENETVSHLPKIVRDMIYGISESDFRYDISSTAIRNGLVKL